MTPWRWIDSLATTTARCHLTPSGNQSSFRADKYIYHIHSTAVASSSLQYICTYYIGTATAVTRPKSKRPRPGNVINNYIRRDEDPFLVHLFIPLFPHILLLLFFSLIYWKYYVDTYNKLYLYTYVQYVEYELFSHATFLSCGAATVTFFIRRVNNKVRGLHIVPLCMILSYYYHVPISYTRLKGVGRLV